MQALEVLLSLRKSEKHKIAFEQNLNVDLE